jgi:small-conductance mechanosensitive channel
MSVYLKTRRAIFWGVAILLTAISAVVMNWLGLFWNLWAQVIDSLVVLIAALVLSRLIPRWLNIEDDR